jgi:hypothetical protein
VVAAAVGVVDVKQIRRLALKPLRLSTTMAAAVVVVAQDLTEERLALAVLLVVVMVLPDLLEHLLRAALVVQDLIAQERVEQVVVEALVALLERHPLGQVVVAAQQEITLWAIHLLLGL